MDVEEQTDTATGDEQNGAVASAEDSSNVTLNTGSPTAVAENTAQLATVNATEVGSASTTSQLVTNDEGASGVTEDAQMLERPEAALPQNSVPNVETDANGTAPTAAPLELVMQLSPPGANIEIADVAMAGQDDEEAGQAENDESNAQPRAAVGDLDEQYQGNNDANDDNDSADERQNVFDMVYDDNEADDESTEFVYDDHVQAVIRELLSRSGRGDGNNLVNILPYDNFMQRMRRALFSMDHHRLRHRNGSSNNSNEAEAEPEEEEPENPVRFDTNLPAEHTYLGPNMDRVSGVNYLEVGQEYRMILFMHQHILFPGEVLPFMISGSIIAPDLGAQNGMLFGVCFPTLGNGEQDENMYGVTCQIYEKGTDQRGNMLIKSRALQRFITKGNEFTGPLQFIANNPQMKCSGYVKILPEIFLPEPLKCINMGSMNRFRDNSSMHAMYRRYQAATTPWPAHVYDYYSITPIIEKARTLLAQHKIDTMPTDPTQLSFWLVRNLHLSESIMKQIFTTNSVNIRMKIISSTFKEDAIFTCRFCGNRIANCRELFAMSKHGVQTQYCNSAGYIHETNTVYQLLPDAISYSGVPSSEFSWFPGYQWHIIVCKICSRHIGWKFKADEPNLVPKSFFGISSSSVRITASVETPAPRETRNFRYTMWAPLNEMQ